MYKYNTLQFKEPVIRQSHIVFPTEDEIKVLTGIQDLDQACEKLLTMGPEIIAIKRGNQGSSVYTKSEKHHVLAFDVKEIDPTGAGDCYCAGFLTGLLKDMTIYETAKFANAVGALSVIKQGTMEGTPTLAEVSDLLRR